MNIFSTRETAIIIWAIVIFIVMLLNKEIRKSVGNIVKIIFSTKIIQPFIGIMIYLSIILLSFFKLGLVSYINLKDILLWVLFSGVPLCYSVVNKRPDKNYFKEIIKENIKLIILLEFIISTFTFPLRVELIIIPIFIFLITLEAVSTMKEEYEDMNKLISLILSMLGFFLLYKSFSIAIKNYRELNYIESLISIATPIILSILYIPLIFIFGIIFNYNNIFYRLKIKLKYKYIKLKSVRFQKYDYKVEKVEDISNGLAKRKSIMLILKEKYEYKDIENICMEQFDLYNYKNDVVWVYVATSKESYIIANWIVQSQWINPKLDSRWRPGEINGVNRNGILFRYNDSCYETENYHKVNTFKENKFLLINNFKLYDEISGKVDMLLNLFKNSNYKDFFELCRRYESDISKIYFKYGNIGISKDIDFEEYLQEFQNYITSISNIILYALDESREAKSKKYLINMIIRDLHNIIHKIEDGKSYWMNKFNITVDEYEQDVFIL